MARSRLLIWAGVTVGVLLIAGFAVLTLGPWKYYYVSGGSFETFGSWPEHKPCPTTKTIDAEDLSTMGLPRCNLVGSKIRMPSGQLLTVPDTLGITGTRIYDEMRREPGYGVANLGRDFGVVAYTDDNMWGTQRGLKIARKAHLGPPKHALGQ